MPDTPIAITIAFHGLAMFALHGLFLADIVVDFRATRRLLGYALIAAGAAAALGGAIVVALFDAVESGVALLLIGWAALGVVQVFLATGAGMRCAVLDGRPSLPLMQRLMRQGGTQRRPNLSHGWLAAVVTAIAFVAVTAILFKFTRPHLSRTLVGSGHVRIDPRGLSIAPQALALLIGLYQAVLEEVVYRLGVQGFLARRLKLTGRAAWIAIIASAALWTAAHAGTLDPNWVKMVQLFPLGLALGALFRSYGVEIAILAHAFFNVLIIPLGPHLVGT